MPADLNRVVDESVDVNWQSKRKYIDSFDVTVISYLNKVSYIVVLDSSKTTYALQSKEEDHSLGFKSGIRAFALRNFDLEVMEMVNTQNHALAKLPMLKLGEYEMWEIRIKQYFSDTGLRSLGARFGGNEATKKTQKALLKQQYENFNATTTESLDSIFNRLQKLVSRPAILGVMNKPDFESMSLDDLYDNFKIVEQKVKKSSGAINGDKNLAFVTASGTSSTNNLHSEVSTGTTKVNNVSTKTCTASFSDDTVYAFLSTQPQRSQIVHKDLEQIHDDDLEEIDLKWNMALLSMKARKAPRVRDNRNWNQGTSTKTVRIEDTPEKAIRAIDGVGFDWSDMAEEEIQTNMALMAFSDSEVHSEKSCSKICLKNYADLKKQYDTLLDKFNDTAFKASTYKRGQLRIELEKVKKEKEGIDFKIAKFDKSAKDLDNMLESQRTDKTTKGLGYAAVPPPHPLILNRPTPLDLSSSGLAEFKEPKFNLYGPRVNVSQPATNCNKESDNSKENTDDSLKQSQMENHQVSDSESTFVFQPSQFDKDTVKDWKEKFFHSAGKFKTVKPKQKRNTR
ncbi:hypothetical protein Tco_0001516 [Tanacetum coccineum]